MVLAGQTLTPVQARSLEKVRTIVLSHLGERPARVWLFGSFARGEAHRFSDIDVAIDAGAALPPLLRANIEEALEESTVPYFVDVVDLAESPSLRSRVEAEGIRWR